MLRSAMTALEEISQVRKRHEAELLGLPGVVGIGVGLTEGAQGVPCILIQVEKLRPVYEAEIPKNLEGVPTRVVVVGEVEALSEG